MAKRKYTRSQLSYWKESVHKVTYTRNGQKVESTQYSVKIRHDGIRRTINLGTSDKKDAAQIALDLYKEIIDKGWESIGRKSPKTSNQEGPESSDQKEPTIGGLIQAYQKAGIIYAPTLYQYELCLKKIISDIAGLKGPVKRYGKKGSEEWNEKVNKLPLSLLKRESIVQWRAGYIRSGKSDKKLQSQKRTANTYIRNSKSLFSSKHAQPLKDLTGFEIPTPSPFADISRLEEGSHTYISDIDAESLAKDAEAELKTHKDQSFKIFVLALVLGLRRDEIDKLRWDNFNFKKKTLKIELTDIFHPKGVASTGELPLSEEILMLFEEYYNKRTSVFVIESDIEIRKNERYRHYRANCHHRHLISWLRSKGVTAQKPLHTLRKELGRILAERFGIYAASKKLRHADLSVTVKHYADDKRLLPTGLESIVTGKNVTQADK